MSTRQYKESERELLREVIQGERPHDEWARHQRKDGLEAPVEHGHHNKRTPSDDHKKGAGQGK